MPQVVPEAGEEIKGKSDKIILLIVPLNVMVQLFEQVGEIQKKLLIDVFLNYLW